jgi:hypothetical protein
MSSAMLTQIKALSVRGIPTRLTKAALSIVTALFFACQFLWTVPKHNALASLVSDKISIFWKFWGFDSDWSFFAPELRTCNYEMVAVMTFEDGTSTLWPLPRFEVMRQYERYAKDKFSKWSIDWMPYEEYRENWPQFARYLGRCHYSGTSKPAMLTVYLFTKEIEKPTDNPRTSATAVQQSRTLSVYHRTLFCYRYKPEDFKDSR